jgi:hypothetical protein
MPNPFFCGPRITDPRYFVGRRAELGKIFSALEMAVTGQVQPVAIIGPRRIGKSSLLYHLTQIFDQHLQNPDMYHFIYVDLDAAGCQTQTGLFKYILECLPLAEGVPTPDLIAFDAALERLHRSGGPCPVVCLDEFEHLTQRKAEFPDDFFTALRSLAQDGKVALVTASKTSLAELFVQGGLTSPFHNIFQPLILGDLPVAEADELLARGRACDRPFTGSECADLRRLAGENPYALQLAGSLLYQAKVAPAPDWDQLKRDFHAQFNFATRGLSSQEQFAAGARRALASVRKAPRGVGRFILDVLKNDKASDATAEILGWVVIALFLWLIFGMIDWGQLSAIVAVLRNLFK